MKQKPPCTCRFMGAGAPMDNSECALHTKTHYPCPQTQCGDYRPKTEPKEGHEWPRCVCGEIAQEHIAQEYN